MGSVNLVAFSADGKRVASGSWDKLVKIWDADKGSEVRTSGECTRWCEGRKVDIGLLGKGNSNSHGARPVY